MSEEREPWYFVDIGGYRWDIYHDAETDRRLDENDSRGETHYEQLEIWIHTDLVAQLKHETLVHEMLHAAWLSTNLRDVLPMVTGEMEEMIVSTLAQVFFPHAKSLVAVESSKSEIYITP